MFEHQKCLWRLLWLCCFQSRLQAGNYSFKGFRSLHTVSEMFVCIFPFSHPFLYKFMLRMRKRWSEFSYDGRKFRRQCVNVIDITWGRIYFLTCKNFGLRVQWPQSEHFVINHLPPCRSKPKSFVRLRKHNLRYFGWEPGGLWLSHWLPNN